MKKSAIVVFLVLICYFLVGCETKEMVKVKVNGVSILGEHRLDEKEGLVLSTKENEWLLTRYPEKKSVSISEIERDYKIIPEKWSDDKKEVEYVILPKDFHYVTARTEEGQKWGNSKTYPKGWIVNVKDYSITNILIEITPNEDYIKGIDQDRYEYGWIETEILEDLPLLAPKKIEIVDFPNGHLDMDRIQHYSVMIEF